jgi:hypothetical protein
LQARTAASFQKATLLQAVQDGIKENLLCLAGHQTFAKLGEDRIMEARVCEI